MASVQTCGGNVVQYNQLLSSDERLGLRGWSRPEVEGIGSEPLAKTGHSSQAGALGVPLNHKSNLWPLRGDGDKYTLRSGNQQPTTISNYLSRGRVSQAGVHSLPSYTIDIYYDYPRPTSGIFQATSSLRNGYVHALYYG
eukprot:scaffold35146_cov80-Skeletonema_marinoi.AAC.1